jgi:hypothetical protein
MRLRLRLRLRLGLVGMGRDDQGKQRGKTEVFPMSNGTAWDFWGCSPNGRGVRQVSLIPLDFSPFLKSRLRLRLLAAEELANLPSHRPSAVMGEARGDEPVTRRLLVGSIPHHVWPPGGAA